MVYNNLTGYSGQTKDFLEDPFTGCPLWASCKVVPFFRTSPIY